MKNTRNGVMLVKIAPGKKAELWEECRSQGYIRVGWDGLNVGDLRSYFARDDLAAAMRGSRYSHSPSVASRITNELWSVRNLQPGDQVLANRGKSEVLGVGTVVEPAYEWDGRQRKFKHKVSVRWTSMPPKQIQKQARWRNTVVPVPVELFRAVTGIRVDDPIDWDEIEKAKRRSIGTAEHRPGQAKFRSRLIQVYRGRCAVTGCTVEEALQAAHIYTISGEDENDPSNGILMRADIHLLFDKGILRVEPNANGFCIVLAPRLRGHREYGQYHRQPYHPPDTVNIKRFCSYLGKRARW